MSFNQAGLAFASDATATASAAGTLESLETIRNAEGLLSVELDSEPLVSVVIPTYNRSKVCLRALKSALAQTYRTLEIIVVDDGSTDDTAAVIAPYRDRIRYIHQTNQGASAARNRAVQEARGKYIAFLDSDDEWLPTKIEKQIALIDAHPELSFVACLAKDERRTYVGYENHATQFMRFIVQPFTQNMTRYVVRRECFEKHGLFDTSIHGPEDWELWLRLLQRGCQFGFVPEELMIYTHSHDAISNRPLAMLAGEAIIRQRYVGSLPNFWQRLKLGAWFRARSYMNAAISFREQGQLWTSLGYMLSSLMISPCGPRTKTRLATLLTIIHRLLVRSFRHSQFLILN